MERRTVIQLGLSALAVGALGSCSRDEPAPGSATDPATAASTDSAPTTATAPAPTTTGPEPSAPGPAADGLRIPLADIPVGGAVILTAEQVVATQPTAGEYRGFSAICTHQGCTLESVQGQDAVCPCHGSRFSIVDGSVVQGPATEPLVPASEVTVDGENLVVVL